MIEVVGVLVAAADREHAGADHVGKGVHDARRIAPIGNARARRSATPKRRSAIARSITPPSEVRRPPSKAAVTFLPWTAGNENSGIVSSVMAGVAGAESAKRVGVSNQILRDSRPLCYGRQPRNPNITNKTG